MVKKLIFSIIVTLLLSNCSGRQKDPDELVLHEYIKEVKGIYYFCDCEEHCGEKKITMAGKNYFSNDSVKNTWKLTDGLPDSLWLYYDSLGNKTIEIQFDKGTTVEKKKF